MELLLRQVKYQAPTRLSRGVGAPPLGIPAPAAPSRPGTLPSPWIETTGTSCSSRPILPPIAIKKQQVLFREPGEVWEQRVHCPDLTLRLQTSYTHLEEAQNRLRQRDSKGSPAGTFRSRRCSPPPSSLMSVLLCTPRLAAVCDTPPSGLERIKRSTNKD
ncbi:hypothetical protein EYF80_022585 [Liparis tanakae]|uniref:Uncharacterized protein n=1 Tax=Liparis tanakae TaxID=230148 RepID=A0A4Z2HMU4_9TELE|nr:hypothetical protein EYF80_022585 [Liparis tanakae]